MTASIIGLDGDRKLDLITTGDFSTGELRVHGGAAPHWKLYRSAP